MTFIRIFISFILLTWISTAHAQIIPLGERLSNLEKNTQPKTPAPQKAPLSALKPTPAAPQSTLQKSSGVSHLSFGKYDIAGIRVGMSPEQVSKILKSKGYTETSSKRGPSFSEVVKLKQKLITKKDAKSALQSMEFVKNYESIEVGFLPFPSSSQLLKVKYLNKDPGLTASKFSHLLNDKYGWPDEKDAIASGSMTWMKTSKQFRDSPAGLNSEILLSLARKQKMSLSLIGPLAAGKALEELVLAQIAPTQTTF